MDWDKAAFEKFYSSNGEPHGHHGGLNGRRGIRLHYHDFSIGQYQRNRYAPKLLATLGLNGGDSVILLGSGFNWTGEGLVALGIDVSGTETSSWILAERGNTEEDELRQLCIDAGVDPDAEMVIWDKNHPLATLVAEPARTAEINVYLTAPHEAESRAKWEAVHGRPPELNDFLLQWKLNPLDVWLRGGRAAPVARGYGKILGEDMTSRKSRNDIHKSLNNSARYVLSEEVLNSMNDAEGLVVCENMAKMASEHGSSVVHMLSPFQDGKQAAELNWKSYADWRTHLTANGFAGQMILPTVTYGAVTAYSGLI